MSDMQREHVLRWIRKGEDESVIYAGFAAGDRCRRDKKKMQAVPTVSEVTAAVRTKVAGGGYAVIVRAEGEAVTITIDGRHTRRRRVGSGDPAGIRITSFTGANARHRAREFASLLRNGNDRQPGTRAIDDEDERPRRDHRSSFRTLVPSYGRTRNER